MRRVKLRALDLLVLKNALKLNTTDPRMISAATGIGALQVLNSLERVGLKPQTAISQEAVIDVALKWLESGGRFEEVSRALSWELFEALIGRILRESGLTVFEDIHIIAGRRRAQLDVVALSERALYLVECKRWFRSFSGALAAEEAKKVHERMRLFNQALITIIGHGDYVIYVVPILVSLYASPTVLDAFISTPRSLFSLLSEHPSALPSPPTVALRLKRPPHTSLFATRRLKIGVSVS